MKPSYRWLTCALSACVALVPGAARACDARQVLDAMRAATGGDRWNAVAQISAYGSATTAALTGTARIDEDLRDGRFAQYFEIPVQGPSASVYDGRTLWSQDVSGGVHPMDSAFPRARAITDSFLAARRYFDRTARAAYTCRAIVQAGHPFAIVRVVPANGIPANLTIATATHRLASVDEKYPFTTWSARYADYRRTGGLVLPYRLSYGTALDPADVMNVTVTRYALSPAVTAADFARPAFRNPAEMAGGQASTTVPMTLEAGQLIVWASIDGHPAMPFILDTGGHAILTTGAAETLGLQGSGAGETDGSGPNAVPVRYANVASVQIGDALIRNQHFLIIPYDYSFYERGAKPPLAGILGLEFYERYATRIDYGARTVTFTPLPSFAYRGDGTPVPIRFQEDMPMVQAAADGHAGLFGTDTGNSGSLILFGQFLDATGLAARYPGPNAVMGRGTGGANTGHIGTLQAFTFGGTTLRDVQTYFTNMQSGSFASWTEGGNVGYRVLSRFVPTYDYADETLYLENDPNAPPLGTNRSGLSFVKMQPNVIDVAAVRPGSAAASAGIAAGDEIAGIDGKPASDYSRADFYDLVTQPAGTRLDLRVTRAGKSRDVTLVLGNV
jgi:PDZ domain/Aspartyl protease